MKAHVVFALLLAFSWCRAADIVDYRMYPATQMVISDYKFGPSSGLWVSVGLNGGGATGQPGHVSDVKWKFLHTNRDGDVYLVTRKYPSDSADPKTDTKEATYSGKALILWQDDYQKIILRPKP